MMITPAARSPSSLAGTVKSQVADGFGSLTAQGRIIVDQNRAENGVAIHDHPHCETSDR
jgi:hypothetical protein